jgi:hypothetical protein
VRVVGADKERREEGEYIRRGGENVRGKEKREKKKIKKREKRKK